MTDRNLPSNARVASPPRRSTEARPDPMNALTAHHPLGAPVSSPMEELIRATSFLEDLSDELEGVAERMAPSASLRMTMHLMRAHLEGRTVTPSAMIGASRAPYGTATRRLQELIEAGLIERRPRTRTGRSFSLHPSATLLERWTRLTDRLARLAEAGFGGGERRRDYYFGGSYLDAQAIPPLSALQEPLKAAGGLRVLVHGDPTFMVMDNLKRQFEQVIGTPINQRAFSIDRLREEALRNAERKVSRYDIVAVDLPWIGEFAERGVLLPLDEAMDLTRLDPADFHTAGWQGAHWGGRPYGVPAQTTPELLFYRRDLFAEAGLEPPATTDQLLTAARAFHAPRRGRHGIAWNAARGTALGHTVLMTLADFGQPVMTLPRIAGGWDATRLAEGGYRATIDTEAGRLAAEFMLELLECSPPEILHMSWYERVRPYAAGTLAMAYGYTLLAPYFETDPASPARGRTGYLPHPAGPGASPVAPVGGYVMGIPANLPEDRLHAAVEALIVFTSAPAQKLYVENGSRTSPRYSVGADPDVRRASEVFEAVDGMSQRDELQFWPRPPAPEICGIIQICGEEFHDMLRGVATPREALHAAQARADALIEETRKRRQREKTPWTRSA